MKVIIAGSRSCVDYEVLLAAIESSGFNNPKFGPVISEVVSGRALGADILGERWQREHRDAVRLKEFPADWNLHGKSAGVIRNKEMAHYAEALIALWDGKSKGTQNMISTAERLGLKVFVYRTDEKHPLGAK